MNINEYSALYESAKQGDPEALYRMGVIWETEHKEDNGMWQAERFYRKAARRGHTGAYLALGDLLFARGDEYLAADMWFIAAEKGSPAAMSRLGRFLSDEGMAELANKYLIRAVQTEEEAMADNNKKEEVDHD